MKTPRVTIITVCYNAVDTIEKTIKSVVTQSYPNIEYIIIDGASTDSTQEIIKTYKNQFTYFQSEPDKGIYDAMNKGIQIATGDWINFMNAGDYFYNKNAVEKIVNVSTQNDVVETQNFASLQRHFASIRYCDVFVQKNDKLNIRQHKPIFQYGLYNNVCHQAVFYNVKKLGKFQFDTQYKISADFDFLLQIATREKGKFYQHILEPLVVYQGGGLSEKRALQALEERKIQFKSHIKNPIIRLWNQLNLYRQKRKRKRNDLL